MELKIKRFEQLSLFELFNIYKLRGAVFVVEQNCPYQDPDDEDPEAFHVLMTDNGRLAGYARILTPGLAQKEPAIGRVLVEKRSRGNRWGKTLMKFCIQESLLHFGDQEITISAQLYLLQFYSDLGFFSEGAEYLEDNIPHIKMRYTHHLKTN